MRYKLKYNNEELMVGSIIDISSYLGCSKQYIYQIKKDKMVGDTITLNYKNKKYSIIDRLF